MRENRLPSLLAAVILHALILGAGLITLPLWSKPMDLSSAVPITIVSHAPPEPPSARVQAPVPTPETTPEPAPEPTPAPPPPPPQPTPTPAPRPAPPKPAPTPAPAPKPAPPQPTPKPQAKPLDLSALADSLPPTKANKASRTASRSVDLSALANTLPKPAGARGPVHSAEGPEIHLSPPRPLSGDEAARAFSKLSGLWGLNCSADASQELKFRVSFHLGQGGNLIGQPELLDLPIIEARGAGAMALARRALAAVVRGDPYQDLPRDKYDSWKYTVVTFDTKEACAHSR